MTSIHIYDPKAADSASVKLTPLPISALVIATLNLLEEASDLPQPRYLTVSSTQSIDLQLPADRSSYQSIAQWALRFGGVVTSVPIKDEKGSRTMCKVEFDYYGIRAEAYAIIPADKASSHVSYPHLPGRLYDCPACQAKCHCTPGDAECVYDGQHNGMAD